MPAEQEVRLHYEFVTVGNNPCLTEILDNLQGKATKATGRIAKAELEKNVEVEAKKQTSDEAVKRPPNQNRARSVSRPYHNLTSLQKFKNAADFSCVV